MHIAQGNGWLRMDDGKKRSMVPPCAFARLGVTVSGPQVIASLEFINRSGADVFVEKFNACINGQIENNVFRIASDGRQLAYIGKLAKRRRPIVEDYLRIEPGRRFRTQADLTRAYDFLQSEQMCEALYSALISYPDRDGLWSLQSNIERFRYSK